MGIPRSLGRLVLAGALVLAALPACSTGGGDGDGGNGPFGVTNISEIQLEPASAVKTIVDGSMVPGDTYVHTIRVINVGTAVLSFDAVRVEYTLPEDAEDDFETAFQLTEPAFEMPFEIHRLNSAEYPQGAEIQVRYTRQTDGVPRSAQVIFDSNDPKNPTVTVTVKTELGSARLTTDPTLVDFGLVPMDTLGEQTLNLFNSGDKALMISGFQILQDARFGVKGAGFQIGTEPGEPLQIDLPDAIPVMPGTSSPIAVTFRSDSPTPADGALRIFSDDPDTGTAGYLVPLTANKSGPCILVEPRDVDFEGKLVGQFYSLDVTVMSCGTQALTIHHIGIGADSSLDFDVDLTALPDGIDDTGPNPTNPLVLPVNESITFSVTFVPDEVNMKDADGMAIPDQGILEIQSDAFESNVQVPLMGAGALQDCPVAVIHVEEGEEVIPQTVLHLDGTQSYAPYGPVVQWLWTVDQPDGSQEIFVPNTTSAQPVFAANVVGLYTFTLRVWDQNNEEACVPAQFTVIVQPDQAVHVELTWVTEDDPDETDTGVAMGTDLDLHFTHPSATGPDLDKDDKPDPWFDTEWDCFWYNPEPNWGSFDPTADDDPSLDRDDTDGAGPENLNLGVPEDDTTYRIGVHYWQSWGFGEVEATVRVFSYADLIFEATTTLAERDMWCVGSIPWPLPQVQTCSNDGIENVVADYVNPFFFTP